MGLALIVGGSAGIGLALAHRFAQAGHDLLLVARNEARLARAAADISRSTGCRISIAALDAADETGLARLIEIVRTQHRTPSFIVIAIGTWSTGPAMSTPPAEVRNLVSVNSVAPQAALLGLSELAETDCQCLVIGSLAGLVPVAALPAYAASKAHLHFLMLAMRDELAEGGIGLSLVSPGFVRTDFVSRAASSRARFFFDLFASSPETVAGCAYRGMLANQRLIVPGLFWRLVYLGVRILPFRLLAKLSRLAALALGADKRSSVADEDTPSMPMSRAGPAR